MWCFCKALWYGLENLEWLVKKPWNDTGRMIWKSFGGRRLYWIVFNQGIKHQEWVQVKIHRRMETSLGQSLHMPILILWIIWKIAEPHTTKMKSANNQGPTDAFSSGAFLEVLATLPRWVMFLLCFSLAIRIRCLATIFAAPAPARPPLGLASFSSQATARLRFWWPRRRSWRLSGWALATAAGPGPGERGSWALAGRGPPTGRRREAGAREEASRPPERSCAAAASLAAPGAWREGRKEMQRNKRTVQPAASNYFGFGCQRQH